MRRKGLFFILIILILAGCARGTNTPPVIRTVTVEPEPVALAGTSTISVQAEDPEGDPLSYRYESEKGKVLGTGPKVTYQAPEEEGTDTIIIIVYDGYSETTGKRTVTISGDAVSIDPPNNYSSEGTMYRYNLGATGYLPWEGGINPPLNLVWKRKLDETGSFRGTPVICQDTIYLTGGNTLFALNKNDGSVKWTFEADDMVYTPAVAGDMVYVGSNDHFIYALNKDDGTKVWEYETYQIVEAAPIVAEGTVVVVSCDGYVYGFNAQTGYLRWKSFIGGHPYNNPAYSDGIVVVPRANYIYALDINSGSLLWYYHDEERVRVILKTTPVIVDGIIYQGVMEDNSINDPGKVAAFDLFTGQLLWTWDTAGDHVVAPVTITEDRIFASTYYDGIIYCLDRHTQEKIWEAFLGYYAQNDYADIPYEMPVGSTAAGGYLFQVSQDKLFVLDQADGTLVDEFQLDNPTVKTEAVVNEGYIYVVDAEGTLYKLGN